MFEPATLIASLLVSGIGYVAFSYGKRQKRLPSLSVGLLLMVFPYFVESPWAIYGIAAALLALLWFAVKQGL